MSLFKHKGIPVLIVLTLMATSCKDYEEFKFVGKVVGAEMCTSNVVGYVLDLTYPDTLGGTITIGGVTYTHAVMAYRSARALMKDETVYGVGYLTESFSALNCFGLIDNDLPEMILISVDEDSNDYKNRCPIL